MLRPQARRPRRVPPPFDAADLQAELVTATRDLERLQALLEHACVELMQGFHGASGRLLDGALAPGHGAGAPAILSGVMQQLGGAITALQFQDMAAQLIAHTHRRLQLCADRLAPESGGAAGHASAADAAARRANPVVQDAMQAGSIELF